VRAHRDAAVLALRLARKRVDDLSTDLARYAGIDTSARRLVQVLACFGPIITALEHLLPDE
jgi:hypothetical protein